MAHLQNASAAQIFFGDKRLHRRLHQTFDLMARRPAGTLPQKLVKRDALVGSYRMLNNPKVTHQAILESHRASCLQRLEDAVARTPLLKVLLLHDTTVLDYSGLDVEGLGQVGNGGGKGLYAHNSLAVIPATRQVVGLFNQILHKRAKVVPAESRAARRQRPDRESLLWKQATENLPQLPEGVEVTDVSDRGSDVMEYIEHEIRTGRQFIVRSKHNRNLADDDGEAELEKLHERLRGLKPMGSYVLRVPADEGGWRETTIDLAWEQVRLLPPRQKRGEHGREPLAVWGLIAREASPQLKEEPIEWILLTNRPVHNAEQAREAVEDYACRWMIEDYHKAIKSGCGIEETQMTTRHGLDNVIGLLSVLGVHVLRLRCNARDEQIARQPACLHEEALKVQLAARDSKQADWRAMTVFEFYIAVAKMGGYVLNPRKRPPGWITLWRGYIRLEDMCEGVRLMQRCV
jgi:hypothetical protein